MAPFDWATCHPVIGSYQHIQRHSQHLVSLPRHLRIAQLAATSASVQPYHLPNHLTYHKCTCRSTSCPYYTVTLPHQHPYGPAVIRTATCQSIIGPRHVRTATCHPTLTHVKSVECQLNPKMLNLSDTCHLLVMPHQDDDVILTSC
jgi:hypothetical protein